MTKKKNKNLGKTKSESSSQKAWRQFEILIAQIEAALAPLGAKLKSPDQIADLVTGDLREVDASIRYQLGSTPILITIECRHRSRNGDINWIEGLATKRLSIGASHTLAVSPRGFSKAAIDLARRTGIEVRQLGEVSATEVLKLFGFEQVNLLRRNYKIARFGITFYGPKPVQEPHPSLKDRGLHDKYLHLVRTDTWISMEEMLGGFGDPQFDIYKDVPHDGKPHRVERIFDFDDETITIPTTDGLGIIKRIVAELHVTIDSMAGTPQGFEYRGHATAVSQGFRQHMRSSDGQSYLLTMSKASDGNEIKCSLLKFDE